MVFPWLLGLAECAGQQSSTVRETHAQYDMYTQSAFTSLQLLLQSNSRTTHTHTLSHRSPLRLTRILHLDDSIYLTYLFFFFSSRRRHTRLQGDWSSDVCSSD